MAERYEGGRWDRSGAYTYLLFSAAEVTDITPAGRKRAETRLREEMGRLGIVCIDTESKNPAKSMAAYILARTYELGRVVREHGLVTAVQPVVSQTDGLLRGPSGGDVTVALTFAQEPSFTPPAYIFTATFQEMEQPQQEA